jgi:hypothetical protein
MPATGATSAAPTRIKKINGEGYWTSMGNDPVTGEPITV